jgi:hypothetical protein
MYLFLAPGNWCWDRPQTSSWGEELSLPTQYIVKQYAICFTCFPLKICTFLTWLTEEASVTSVQWLPGHWLSTGFHDTVFEAHCHNCLLKACSTSSAITSRANIWKLEPSIPQTKFNRHVRPMKEKLSKAHNNATITDKNVVYISKCMRGFWMFPHRERKLC